MLDFSAGSCVVEALPEGVRLTAEAEDAEKLAVVEDVVARHLVRFGEKDELSVGLDLSVSLAVLLERGRREGSPAAQVARDDSRSWPGHELAAGAGCRGEPPAQSVASDGVNQAATHSMAIDSACSICIQCGLFTQGVHEGRMEVEEHARELRRLPKPRA